MYRIHEDSLPCPEAELRAALERYQAALEAHKLTVGEPAPWPEYEVLRDIVGAGGLEVIAKELPPEPTPAEIEARALEQKRAAALKALDDARLAEAMLDPLAPAEVKDYAMAVEASTLDAEPL